MLIATLALTASMVARPSAPAAPAVPSPVSPAVASSGGRQADDSVLAIRARTIVTGTGRPIENGTILIAGGKIRAVGAKLEIPADAAVIDHDGWVTAGMIALHGSPGMRSPRGEAEQMLIFLGEAERARQPQPAHAEPDLDEVEVWVDPGEDASVVAPGEEHADEPHGHDHEAEPPAAEEPAPAADPAFVDAFATPYAAAFAADNEGAESARVAIPDAELGQAFDPESLDFGAALASGITTFVLTPISSSVAPGQSATVKTALGRVLDERAQLSLGFGADALEWNRAPTSHAGALAEIEARFAKPEGPFAEAKTGELPVLFEVATRQDAVRAAEFARRHALKGTVNGGEWIGEVAQSLRAAGLSAVVGPFALGVPQRSLRSVLELAKAGVPFGFGLDSPGYAPAMLRVSAALCVREGLDRELAWNALTRTAAEIAGVQKRVGRIESGLDADLVLWSGDPLDLASRVERVLVEGALVHGGVR